MKRISSRIMSRVAGFAAATLATASFAVPAMAMDNSHYGEARINQLPEQGRLSHAPWVGSWWAYKTDGIAYRHKLSRESECSGVSATDAPAKLVEDGKAFCLSAAEKVDYLAGRIDAIDWENINEYQRITKEDLGTLQEEIRELVRTLNKWLSANPGENWRETDDGKRYLELNKEMDEKKASLPEIEQDTATEFERIEHGNGVPGVGGWWGHCNAWSAAALMEDEPKTRGTATFEDRTVDFTPGEVKALMTEAWMEHHASFYGSRHDDKENEGVSFEDISPAAFHIYFGTQLGMKQKGFVIDRYTGDQVWNQAVRSYTWKIEPLYENDEAVTKEVFLTEYDRYSGKADKKSQGEQAVYPVQVEATFHWITDGLPHEQATVDNILEDAYPTTHSELSRLWGRQVELRHLTYTLYLDRPISDESSRIIGDGEWKHGDPTSNQNHPDFAWQPLTQTPTRRNYENPYIEWDRIVLPHIVPVTKGEEPTVGSGEFTSADTPIAIPDKEPAGITSTLNVETAGKLTKASVTVDIAHTWIGDLNVVLVRSETEHKLHSRSGSGQDDLKKTYDLPAVVGADMSGEWTLRVSDHASQDEGTLVSWKLDFEWE